MRRRNAFTLIEFMILVATLVIVSAVVLGISRRVRRALTADGGLPDAAVAMPRAAPDASSVVAEPPSPPEPDTAPAPESMNVSDAG